MIVLRSARSYFIHLIFIVSSKLFSFLYSFGLFDLSNSVCHVVEGNNWVVSRIGSLFLDYYIHHPSSFEYYISKYPLFSRSKVIHFGSPHLWLRWHKYLTHRISIVNFYHGSYDPRYGNPEFIDSFLSTAHLIDVVVTSCSITKSRLLSWGVPSSKIHLIPLGIDVSSYSSTLPSVRRVTPTKEFIIGSFQKDSVGWGSSSNPKLIKGPDLFIQTLNIIKKTLPNIHVLLTGPSRDYIKYMLSKSGIKFTHLENIDSSYMPFAFKCLDLYLITSREEGGPLALLESLASNVPVVSTPCGRAVDLPPSYLLHVTSSFDAKEISSLCIETIRSKPKLSSLNSGSDYIYQYDWSSILPQFTSLYSSYICS